MFISAGIITLIFAILERTQAKLQLFDKWNLQSLPPAPKQQQPPSRTQSIFDLICGVLGLMWLLALPQYPFLLLGPAAAFLKPAPIWHSFYPPMIAIALAGLVRQGIGLMRPQWAWLHPAGQLLTTVLSLVMVKIMIDAGAQTPTGEWHPYVVVANSLQNSVHLNRVTGVVNLSVLLTLAVSWIGLCIAGLLQTWTLMRHLRKRAAHTRDAALLRMLF